MMKGFAATADNGMDAQLDMEAAAQGAEGPPPPNMPRRACVRREAGARVSVGSRVGRAAELARACAEECWLNSIRRAKVAGYAAGGRDRAQARQDSRRGAGGDGEKHGSVTAGFIFAMDGFGSGICGEFPLANMRYGDAARAGVTFCAGPDRREDVMAESGGGAQRSGRGGRLSPDVRV